MNPSGSVLEVTGLTAEAGGRTLVDGVSFALAAGEVLALVGASGSGKTTIGLALLGEHSPGVRLSGEIRRAAGAVAYVPQHPSAVLNPARRVGAVLKEIARSRARAGTSGPAPAGPPDGAARLVPAGPPGRAARLALAGRGAGAANAWERVLDAARRARLPAALLGRYPHQLSGGQQQRVVLAQALLLDPVLIVADEPTTGQDPVIRREVTAELGGVRAQGVAVVLLSHDLDMVRALADHVVVMRAGRAVESGPAGTILESPAHDYTRRLIAAQPAMRPAMRPGRADAPEAAEIEVTGLSATESGRPGAALIAFAQPGGEPRRSGPRGAEAMATGAGWAGRPGAALVQVTRLTAGHRRSTVLHDVTLAVQAGECLAVVGRSGSGKTTLARCVAGLHPPTGGAVSLDGRPLPRRLARRNRRDVAGVQYVFQDARASFDPLRTVAAQVARSAVRLRGLPAAAAHDAALDMLARTGLDARTAERRPPALSGGELQRAALARALLAGPRVLICDEITSGLDTLVQAGILDLLDELRRDASVGVPGGLGRDAALDVPDGRRRDVRVDGPGGLDRGSFGGPLDGPGRDSSGEPIGDLGRARGLGLILVSHDMGVVARLADRVVVVDGGRIIEEGTAEQVLRSPVQPLTKALVAAPR
ncbi:ATP-binding cassette domain-containing protein [Streptosporangium soli]|nr:ATP-binding cassette domain-containing protein [Streptosporangium sp. KLBMP 9127]